MATKGSIDWDAVQAFHDAGNTIAACALHFGFTRYSWYKAEAKGKVSRTYRHEASLDELLVAGRRTPRQNLKKRVLSANLLQNRCSICSLEPEWQGRKLVLVLDHINGVNDDNRIENLRLLCPNCNSQQETFCNPKKS